MAIEQGRKRLPRHAQSNCPTGNAEAMRTENLGADKIADMGRTVHGHQGFLMIIFEIE